MTNTTARFHPDTRKLIAIWGLIESGLGGYMHAMKIPFTGIVLGGSAVLILTLIARWSENPFRDILRATLIVMLIKFTVSPHTSVFAYIAVAFQGVLAALLLSLPVPKKITIPLFIWLAMLESAMQKFILATLYFGEQLWVAIDGTALKIGSELGISKDWASSFGLKLVLFYCGLYTLWSILLSIWAIRLPGILEKKKAGILSQMTSHAEEVKPEKRKKSKGKKWLGLTFLLLFIAWSFFYQYSNELAIERALLLLFRTVAILLFYWYGLSRLFRWFMKRLQQKQGNQKIQLWMQEVDSVRYWIPLSWKLSVEKKGLRRYPDFFFNLLVLSLYAYADHPVQPTDS